MGIYIATLNEAQADIEITSQTINYHWPHDVYKLYMFN